MRSNRSRCSRSARHATRGGVAMLFLALGLAAASAAGAAAPLVCYAVADDGNGPGPGSDSTAEDLLTRIDPFDPDPATNEVSIGDGTGTFDVEASAIDPASGALYAVDLDRLGVIDLSSGVFTAIGPAVGSGTGSAGTIVFNDIDGLTFDPRTGVLYASQRIAGDAPDVLLQIDPDTGTRVADAFGPGADYVQITPLPGETKIDDLAVTADGTMYAIANVGGEGDELVTIDPATGALTVIGPTGADDLEGLTAPPGGGLIGVTGKEGTPSEGLWDIDPATGRASNFRPLDNAADYESISCVARAAGPSPSPTPSATATATGTPAPTGSPTVGGVKVIPETGPAAAPALALAGGALLVAGVALRRLAGEDPS